VIENSTQGNFTRLVFHVTGIIKIIKKNEATPLYLDEQKSIKVSIGRDGHQVDFPKILYEHPVKWRENSFLPESSKVKNSYNDNNNVGNKESV